MAKLISICATGGLFVLVTTGWGGRTDQERLTREPNSGAYLYRTYCASCHGASGHGDGPAAKTLRVAPVDLTTIAERRGGVFPSSEIAQVIDGRKPVPGHTSQDMRHGVVCLAEWSSETRRPSGRASTRS